LCVRRRSRERLGELVPDALRLLTALRPDAVAHLDDRLIQSAQAAGAVVRARRALGRRPRGRALAPRQFTDPGYFEGRPVALDSPLGADPDNISGLARILASARRGDGRIHLIGSTTIRGVPAYQLNLDYIVTGKPCSRSSMWTSGRTCQCA
jgi:hypothetical protein